MIFIEHRDYILETNVSSKRLEKKNTSTLPIHLFDVDLIGQNCAVHNELEFWKKSIFAGQFTVFTWKG